MSRFDLFDDDVLFDMRGLDSLTIEIAAVLARLCLAVEEPLITYGQLAQKLSYDISPRNLDNFLGQLSDFCRVHGMPLLTVIVVNQTNLRPGDGFFRYFFPHVEKENWDAIFVEEYKAVLGFKQWSRLIDSTLYGR